MKTAAVSELKACLSDYLSKVKKGEEVLITDRGKPVAKIVPLAENDSAGSAHLVELERSGLLRRAKGRLPESFWKALRPKDPQDIAVRVLCEEREEGR
jgi:prevent-host-death family protein